MTSTLNIFLRRLGCTLAQQPTIGDRIVHCNTMFVSPNWSTPSVPASVTPVNVPVSADPSEQIVPVPVIAQQPMADLDRIERDLAAVEVALDRLAAGTYFLDEVTGAPLSEDVLELDPLARRER